MPDYKRMYYTMFNAMIKVNERLCQIAEIIDLTSDIIQTEQRDCEEIFMDSSEPPIVFLDNESKTNDIFK